MTIAITLDPETEKLALRLAEATGKPLPQVVKDAIEASASAAGVGSAPGPDQLSPGVRLAKMLEILQEIDKLPVCDDRSADEIIGYDENGLPT